MNNTTIEHSTSTKPPFNITKKILLADHDANQRRINLSLLEQAGYLVDLADGSEHITAKLAHGNAYNMILVSLGFFDATLLTLAQHMKHKITNKNKLTILVPDVLSFTIAEDFCKLGLGITRRPLSVSSIAHLLEEQEEIAVEVEVCC